MQNNILEPDISLVSALWHYIEDGGPTEEFFELRERVRRHAALYDAAPALLRACNMVLEADGDLYAIDFDMIRAAIASAGGAQQLNSTDDGQPGEREDA